MATRKTQNEIDFDAWTEADEERAIAALVPEVQHIIVGRKFIGRFSDGETVELPLTLSLDDIDELEQQGLAPVDQVKHLLTTLAGEQETAKFTKHDIFETTQLATRFFRIFERVNQASLPE
ncbi:hypothetical protein AB3K78_15540 [Leucobacter sp. HNU]|uniref:hypothetical protein n=1 Tax=Leucobacter sp. HNU TaxID=3236805 RepID=UPI003A80E2DA